VFKQSRPTVIVLESSAVHFITKLKSTRRSNKSTYCKILFSGTRIILPVMGCCI